MKEKTLLEDFLFKGGFNINYVTLNQYLLKKNVVVLDEYFKWNRNFDEEQINRQINLIFEIHEILKGYYSDGTTRISSVIGKKLESIKVEVKKLKNNSKEIEAKVDLNPMDKFLMENGESIINQAEEALDRLKEINYLELIKSSMKENEICLGRVDEGNLRKNQKIEIGSLKNISYNLKEEDVYEYLRKVRRRKGNLNNDEIERLLRGFDFSDDSNQYIKALMAIPYDSLKQWYRYSRKKREIDSEEYLENIKKSLSYEGEIL